MCTHEITVNSNRLQNYANALKYTSRLFINQLSISHCIYLRARILNIISVTLQKPFYKY